MLQWISAVTLMYYLNLKIFLLFSSQAFDKCTSPGPQIFHEDILSASRMARWEIEMWISVTETDVEHWNYSLIYITSIWWWADWPITTKLVPESCKNTDLGFFAKTWIHIYTLPKLSQMSNVQLGLNASSTFRLKNSPVVLLWVFCSNPPHILYSCSTRNSAGTF